MASVISKYVDRKKISMLYFENKCLRNRKKFRLKIQWSTLSKVIDLKSPPIIAKYFHPKKKNSYFDFSDTKKISLKNSVIHSVLFETNRCQIAPIICSPEKIFETLFWKKKCFRYRKKFRLKIWSCSKLINPASWTCFDPK